MLTASFFYFLNEQIETANILTIQLQCESQSESHYLDLDPPVFRYLLEDLSEKLKSLLISRKRTIFLPTSKQNVQNPASFLGLSPLEVLNKIKGVFGALLHHLSNLFENVCVSEEEV